MNAFEYGVEHFKSKYQPRPNIVVFNNETVVLDDLETDNQEQTTTESQAEAAPLYIYAEVNKVSSTVFSLPEPLKEASVNYVENYLIPNGYFQDIGDYYEVLGREGTFKAYAYGNKFYIRYLYPEGEPSTEEVVIKSPRVPFKRKLLTFAENKLGDLINNPDIKLIFFFSREGSKLEVAYQKINDVKPDEIVFFLEKDEGVNIAGSVSRILTGKSITKQTKLPYKSIASLARFFKVDAETKDVRHLFKFHIKAKENAEEQGAAYYLNKVLRAPIVVSSYGFNLLGIGLKGIGDGISDLALDSKRWEYYDKEGNKSKTFKPLFPGLETALNDLDKPDKNEEQSKPIETLFTTLETKLDAFFAKTKQEALNKYFRRKFQFLYTIVKKLKTLYTAFKDKYTQKNALIYINALFTGFYNSIVKAIGGIIALVGIILQIPQKASDLEYNKSVSSISGAFELLEEFIETTKIMFSIPNIEALFTAFITMGKQVETVFSNPSQIVSLTKAFALKAADKTGDAVNYLSTRVDSIGYGLGFAIGFIVEEVVTALATGGAKTVIGALKFTLNSFADLFKTIAKAGGKTLKGLALSPITIIEGVAALLKYLRRLDVKQLLDNFVEWFVTLFKTTKKLAEEAFEKLYSRIAKERITKAGYKPTGFNGDVIIFCPIKP